MTDNSNENGAISVNDAVSSLLNAPELDTAQGERPEAEEPLQTETEAEYEAQDNSQELEADYEEEVEEVEDTDDGYEDDAEPEQPSLYTVKVDGEELEVTLEELQSGYSRTSVFTKRQQELAEQRKALEAEAEQTRQYRDAYAKQLEAMASQAQQTTQAEPDWNALKEQGYSIDELFLAKNEWDKNQKNVAQIQQEQARIAQEQDIENQHKMREHLEVQRQEMLNRIPQWSDEDTRNAERLEVIKYAQSRGFSEDELANATDARAIEILHKAWQWDNLSKKTPDAKKRTKQAPKMAKAGQPKTKQQVQSRSRQQALQRLSKEGTVNSAVDFLMSR